MKAFRNLLLTSFFVLAAASAEAAIAPSSPYEVLPVKPITLQISKIGARDVIRSMLEQAPVSFVLPDTLTNNIKVSVDAQNTSWTYVFNLVVDRSGFDYTVSPEGVVTVFAKDVQ